MRGITGALAALCAALAASAASAQEYMGAPLPGQLGLPEPVTEVARRVDNFHDVILVLITAITLFVLLLLGYVAIRFRASANPTPSRTTHHTLLEIVWTAVPAVILVALVFPTLRLLYLQEDPPEADLVIKATGHQWYWSYEYPDEEIEFDSLMLSREDVSAAGMPDSLWKLAADEALVVPVNATVLVQVTASDVIHAWTVPNFGSKVDAVPGRLNQTWFRAERQGVFFGQCSELCGKDHAYMPIMVRVVSPGEYRRWLARAREEFASLPVSSG